MRVASRKKMLMLPVGLAASFFIGICAEIFGIAYLVPLAFLTTLLTVAYISPALAVIIGDLYGYRAKKDVRYSLVAGALKYRSNAIGASALLLFVVSAMIAIVIGLVGSGVGEVSQGQSYWKDGYRWGVISENKRAEIDRKILSEDSENVGKYSQARMKPQERSLGLPKNAFIMTCESYQRAAMDIMSCPELTSPAIYIPTELNEKTVSQEIVFPTVSDEPLIIPSAPIIRVPGLTEILISPELLPVEPPIEYLYASPNVSDDDIIRLVDYTSVGFSSQEGINSKSAEMRQGYLSIAKYLYVTLLIFAVTIIIAQSSSAIFDRQKLLRSMLLRGFEEKIGERLITLETAHLSVPYIISGYSLGVLAALAVAKMSSMDPSKVISSDIVMAAFLLLGSAFIFPFAQLRLLRRKVP